MLPGMRSHHRIVLCFALLLGLGAVGVPVLAANESPEQPAATASLKGKFLVAHPSLPDPRFAHAVILMVEHDATGAVGLIVNRPLGVAEVTPDEPGAKTESAGHPKPLRFPAAFGGPVGQRKVFIIHSDDYGIADTVRVAPHVAVTADARILNDIADGKGPKRMLYVVGYAGWGPGQLEGEMARDSWYEAPVDDGLIFGGGDSDAVWKKAMATRLRGI